MTEEVEEDFVEGMKGVIASNAEETAQKVILSASQFIKKKDWIKEASEEEFNTFLNQKLPKVLSTELSKKLNASLGLDL